MIGVIKSLLLVHAIASMIQAFLLMGRRDEFRTDIILLFVGSLWVAMYLASSELLKSSFVMPLYGLWQAYGVMFFIYVGRGFFVPGVGMLRAVYFSSVLFLLSPILLSFFIRALIALA